MALDLNALVAEAQVRYDKMKGNPNHLGDPDFTFSAWILDLAAEISGDVVSEAEDRRDTVLADSSPAYVRKTLVGEVLDGKFDKP